MFILSIVLPALLLAYFSIRAVEDEKERALEDQRRIAALLRKEVDRIVLGTTEKSRWGQWEKTASWADLLEIGDRFAEHIFVLDSRREFLYARTFFNEKWGIARFDFELKMGQGQRLEFAKKDYAGAIETYRRLARGALDNKEKAIVLNALGRCYLKSEAWEDAKKVYIKVTEAHPLTFDYNEAHLATYAHFQIAHIFAQQGSVHEALLSLRRMADKVVQGEYPVYPGCRYHLGRAKEMAITLKAKIEEDKTDTVKATDSLLTSLAKARS